MARGTRFKEPVHDGKKYRLPLVLNILALLFLLSFTKAGGVLALILVAISFYLRNKRADQKNYNVAAPKANKRMSIAALALSALVVPLGIGTQTPQAHNSVTTQAVVAQSELATKSAPLVKEAKSASLTAEKDETTNTEALKNETKKSETPKNTTPEVKQKTTSVKSEPVQKVAPKQVAKQEPQQKAQKASQAQAEKKQESVQSKAQAVEKKEVQATKPVEAEPVAVTYEEPVVAQNQSEKQSANKSSNKKASSSKKPLQNNSSTEDNSAIVYITDTGSKYHRSTCSALKKSIYDISLKKAKESHYEPCEKCNP